MGIPFDPPFPPGGNELLEDFLDGDGKRPDWLQDKQIQQYFDYTAKKLAQSAQKAIDNINNLKLQGQQVTTEAMRFARARITALRAQTLRAMRASVSVAQNSMRSALKILWHALKFQILIARIWLRMTLDVMFVLIPVDVLKTMPGATPPGASLPMA
jgi:hypothetical protein